jgi:steroid delta-isomerase-like uncharacterized protein
MSVERNKEIARTTVEEAFLGGNLDVIDQYVADNFVDHAAPPGLPPGREGVKQLFTMLRAAFPDLQATIDDVIAEGDKVVHRSTASGTHRGEFMGIPPTNKRATWGEIHILRFENGRIAEHWGQMDMAGMMQQLGVAG